LSRYAVLRQKEIKIVKPTEVLISTTSIHNQTIMEKSGQYFSQHIVAFGQNLFENGASFWYEKEKHAS